MNWENSMPFTAINCPLCGSDKYSLFIKTYDRFDPNKKEIFKIVRCDRCGFVYLNPRPMGHEIYKYYKREDYDPFVSSGDSTSFRSQVYKLIRKINLNLKAARISKISKPGNLLDVGCATGEFLFTMKKRGWNVVGVEPDEKARGYAQDSGITVFPNIGDVSNNEKFDIVTFWHVLEHVYDFYKTMDYVSKFIKEGGFLIVAVPNIDSIDFKIYDKNWVALDSPRHLYHFSPVTIRNLLRRYNFKMVNSWPITFDLLYNQLMSYYLKYPLYKGWLTLLKGVLYSLFKTYVISVRYSSTLVYNFVRE